MSFRLYFKPENLAIITIITAFMGQALSINKLYLFHIVSIIFIFSIFIDKSDLKSNISKIIKSDKLLWFPCLYTLYPLATIFWSQSNTETLKRSAFNSFGIILFLSFVIIYFSNKKVKILALKTLFGIFCIHLCFSLIEIITPFRWPFIFDSSKFNIIENGHKPGSFDYNNIIHSFNKLTRATTFFWNPNNSAFVSLLATPFLLFSKNKYIISIFFPIIVFGIYTGDSRFVLLSFSFLLIISMAYFFISKINDYTNKVYSRNTTYVILFLVLFSALFFFQNINSGNTKRITQLITSTYSRAIELNSLLTDDLVLEGVDFNNTKFRDKSMEIRVSQSVGTLKVLKKNLFFGVGAGSLILYSFKHPLNTMRLSSIHNYWLEVLTEYGVFFFLIYITWIFYLLKRLYMRIKQSNANKNLRKSALLSFLIFLPSCLVISSAVYFLPKWILFSLAYYLSIEEVEIYPIKV